MNTEINTKNSSDHRSLRFESIDDCIAEIERIVAAEEKGTLRTTGNWTAGQIFSHLAAWIEYGYGGFPMDPPPFFIRWFLRWQLPKILDGKMTRGVRIPRIKAGTTGMDEAETREAADRLVIALNRLKKREEARYESPAFGPMSHDDRIRLNLRHCELHLGYLTY